jgi:thiol-disulfide isomerase/thioredoxin
MKKVTVIAVLLVLLGAACREEQQAAPNRGSFKGAPAFSLKDDKGTVHTLSELKGNVIVLHFWASWCPPCLEEIGNWLKFAEQYGGPDSKVKAKFVAVSLDESWNDAHKILPATSVPANVLSLLDLSKELPEKFGTYQYPETYLIGPDLTIVTKWVGPQNWDNPNLKNILERVAAGH